MLIAALIVVYIVMKKTLMNLSSKIKSVIITYAI